MSADSYGVLAWGANYTASSIFGATGWEAKVNASKCYTQSFYPNATSKAKTLLIALTTTTVYSLINLFL